MECKEPVLANCISQMRADPSSIPSNESRIGNVEAMGTETPYPVQNSQLPYFLKPVRLVALPQPCAGAVGDEQSGRATWSIEEDVVLAKAWIIFSEDRKKLKSLHGYCTFWEHIEKHYNERRPVGTVKRDWTKLKAHWNPACREVTDFNTIYNKLQSTRSSGQSDEDILLHAYEEYRTTHKGNKFAYLHLWNILRYCPMWAANSPDISKKTRTSEPGQQHTSSSSADDTLDVGMECKEPVLANCTSKLRADPSSIPSNETRSGNIEGMVTETPYPVQNSQLPYFLKPVRLVALPQQCAGGTGGGEQSGRATWSIEEDVVLAKAWIAFSEDRKKLKSLHGHCTFWEHIEKHYNERRPVGTVKRDWRKLKAHWNPARREVTDFNTIYNKLQSTRPSGQSDEDILLHAHEEYRKTHKGIKFAYLHLWNILRYCPMWAANSPNTSKKMRTSEPRQQHSSSSSADDTLDAGIECKEPVRANCISKMRPDPSSIPSNETRSGNIEGMGTETPYPAQDYPLPYFLKPVRLVSLPQPCAGTGGDEQSGRATWSIEEDVVLAKAWIAFSEDRKKLKSLHGHCTFWEHIEKHYNERRPVGAVKRDWAKLKSHWNQARRKVTHFNTIYNRLQSTGPSGQSEEHILLHAHEEYRTTHKGINFAYLHLWNILRYCPIWAASSDKSKKFRTSEPGQQHTSSSSAEDTVDVDEGKVLPRPLGKKDRKRKRKAPIANVDQISITMQKQLEKLEEYNQLKARDTFVGEYQILMKDTSAMTEEQVRLHRFACETIKKNWGM